MKRPVAKIRPSRVFKRRQKVKRVLYTGGIICLLGGLSGLFFVFAVANSLPSIEQIQNHTLEESTKIYDRTGTVLLYDIYEGKKRTVVPFNELPKSLKDATIAIEDQHFYEGPAFSVKGIIRAFIINAIQGRVVQGGSTITQQLAKNAFLTSERTITRKVRELLLALKLDRSYTKDEILELYLNEIPYGSTLYGSEAASEAYFGKPVKELSLKESAVLAALPKAPSYYSPWGSHVDKLLGRSELVLAKMKELGMITDQEFSTAKDEQVQFTPQDPRGIKAPHFVVMVQEYLVEKYGEYMVRNGGLQVRTTLNWDFQQIAEDAVLKGAERNEELYDGKNAALVAEDPATGQILALVGSRDYFDTDREGNFNVAANGLRQPGSALKPFVYLTAFQKGYTPETVVFDVPTEFNPGAVCPTIPNFSQNTSSVCFHPENFDGVFRGPTSFRTALSQSVNVPAVKVLYLAGLRNAINLMRSFGITTLSPDGDYGLSLVLGGGAVRLIDLVHAYATLSQEGVYKSQVFISEVRDRDGNMLESFKDDPGTRVSDPQYPRMVTDILSDVDARSGLFHSSLSLTIFPGHDVALKTGTSNDYKDAWTVGYTPSLVVGVWAGNNDNSAMHRQGSSILAALPMWSDFMGKALESTPFKAFTKPDPGTSENPLLLGNYAPNGEVHNILYFIDKNRPSVLSPGQTNDSQFSKWEAAVRLWAERQGGSLVLPGTGTQSPFAPFVEIVEPLSGSVITGNIPITAIVKNPINAVNVDVFFDNILMASFTGESVTAGGGVIKLALPYPASMLSQHEIRVQTTDTSGISRNTSVIVYGDQLNP